jgi:cytochrome c-type biogenesis protein CcmH
MTGFLIAAAVAVALVLVLLLRPFLWKSASSQASHRQINTAIYREQLARLEQDLTDGTLSQQDYANARAELQRRALEDTKEEDAVATLHAPRRTLVTVALLVPLAAAGLYAFIGNPGSMSPAGHGGQAVSDMDVERMVTALAAKLEKDPGNQKGWALLARSYKAMGRGEEAERAFERAGSFIDDDAQMLAHYADAAASNAGGKFAGKPAMLIDKALKVDPNNGMALWLAGTAALETNNYAKALETWQKLAAMLPPDSEDARMLQGAISDVQGRLAQSGGGKSVTASAGGKASPAATPVAPAAAASPQVTAGGSVSGTVELDASLKGKAAPSDTVMVIARLPGSRMPLAVLRVPASQFPMKFTLDDSLAMNPQARLSTASEVEVEARISKTGMAKTEAGDLISPAQTVKVGATNVALRVAQVRQ